MEKFLKEYVLKNWYPILVILMGILIYLGVFTAEQSFLFPGSWALLLIIPGLLYLKMQGTSSLTMIAMAFGVFFIVAAVDYSGSPENGGGILESNWTPWLLMLIGAGIIAENFIKPHTIIRK